MRVKNEKGVTLVSLLVTVIIMIILAGITIGNISSNENRFDEMAEVTKDYSLQSMIESVRMAEIYLKLDLFTEEDLVFNIDSLIDKTQEIIQLDPKIYEIQKDTLLNTATIKYNKMNIQINIEIEPDNTVNIEGIEL